MRRRLVAVTGAATLAATFVPGPASAEVGPIAPLEVVSGGPVTGTVLRSAPTGEGLVALTTGVPAGPVAVAVRDPWGTVDAARVLVDPAGSPTPNSGSSSYQFMPPGTVASDGPAAVLASDGAAFLAWGTATGTTLFADRPASGPFGPVRRFDGESGARCARTPAVAVGPAGDLLVACVVADPGGGPYRLEAYARTASETTLSRIATVQASVPESVVPLVAVGADGTRAVVWRADVAPGISQLRAAVAPAGGPDLSAAVSVLAGGAVTADDVAVLADGSVVVVYRQGAALRAAVRPAGAAAPFVVHGLAAEAPVAGEVEADGSHGAALLAWAQATGTPGRLRTVVARRPPGGGVLVERTLQESGSTHGAGLVVGADGTAVLGHRQNPGTTGSDPQVAAWLRAPGEDFTGPHPVATAATGRRLTGAAVAPGPGGAALASWIDAPDDPATGAARAMLGGLDAGDAPTLADPTVPTAARAGQLAEFAADASDWAGIASVRWDFGDGGTGAGTSVRHAYAAPGTYQVTVSATDRAGNTSSRTAQVVVTDPVTAPPTPPVADTRAPTVTLAVPPRLTFGRLRGGVMARIRSDEAADLHVTMRVAPRSGGPETELAHRAAAVVAGGVVQMRLTPRNPGPARPILVRISAVATDGAGNSRTVVATIRIRR